MNRVTSLLLSVALVFTAQCTIADEAPQKKGALFTGNLYDACITSAMSAAILSASRDKGISQDEAEANIAQHLAKDPNRDFYLALVSQNANLIYREKALSRATLEQVALARCARIAKNKTGLSDEAVAGLVPAITKCQDSGEELSIKNQCVLNTVFEAQP